MKKLRYADHCTNITHIWICSTKDSISIVSINQKHNFYKMKFNKKVVKGGERAGLSPCIEGRYAHPPIQASHQCE